MKTPMVCCASTCPKVLICRFILRGQLDEIVHRLNTRPRAALDLLMPIEAYQAELDKFSQASALHV